MEVIKEIADAKVAVDARNGVRDRVAEGISGSVWRRLWQAAADSVFPDESRPVFSHGDRFFNRDAWTARAFVGAMVEDLQRAKRERRDFGPLTLEHVARWCAKANAAIDKFRWGDEVKAIVIAATADKMNRSMRDAGIGGCIHEKAHTKYSCRRRLNPTEMFALLEPVWDLVPSWALYGQAILDWGNLIEDCRIERLTCRQYRGVRKPLEELQDFILSQERAGLVAAEHRGLPTKSALRVISGAFRDVGLGYDTPSQRAALNGYESDSPEGWAFVMEGPLRPFWTRRSRSGRRSAPPEEMIWLTSCSPCGWWRPSAPHRTPRWSRRRVATRAALPSQKLRSRKVPGDRSKIAIVCLVCGHTHEIDREEPPQTDAEAEGSEAPETDEVQVEDPYAEQDDSEGGEESDREVIRAERDDPEDGEEDGDGDADEDGSEDADSEEGEDTDSDSEDGGSDSEDGGSDSEEGEDTDSDSTDDGDSDSDSSDDGGSDEGEDSDSDSGDDGDDPEDGEEVGDGEADDDSAEGGPDDGGDADGEDSTDEGGEDAGDGDSDEDAGHLTEEMLADLMSDMEEGDGNGLLDSLTALSDVAEKEDTDTREGEKAWQDRGMRVMVPERAVDSRVRKVENAARRVAGAAKVQLRRLFLEARRAETFHGVRKGQGLSTRRLVPSALEMRHGMRPTRPDYTTTKRPDVTLAAAIMTDQSGSMRGCVRRTQPSRRWRCPRPSTASRSRPSSAGSREARWTCSRTGTSRTSKRRVVWRISERRAELRRGMGCRWGSAPSRSGMSGSVSCSSSPTGIRTARTSRSSPTSTVSRRRTGWRSSVSASEPGAAGFRGCSPTTTSASTRSRICPTR